MFLTNYSLYTVGSKLDICTYFVSNVKKYCLGTTALPGDVFYIDQKFIVIIEEALKINILFSLNWILKTDTLG